MQDGAWPEARRHAHSKIMIEAARRRVARQMAWCPEGLRDDYRLLRFKGVRAPEARAMIENQIARSGKSE